MNNLPSKKECGCPTGHCKEHETGIYIEENEPSKKEPESKDWENKFRRLFDKLIWDYPITGDCLIKFIHSLIERKEQDWIKSETIWCDIVKRKEQEVNKKWESENLYTENAMKGRVEEAKQKEREDIIERVHEKYYSRMTEKELLNLIKLI